MATLAIASPTAPAERRTAATAIGSASAYARASVSGRARPAPRARPRDGRGAGGPRFERPVRRGRSRAAGAQPELADVSGVAREAGDGRAIDDQSAADAGRDDHRQGVAGAGGGALPVLGERDARTVEREAHRDGGADVRNEFDDRQPRDRREVQRRDRALREVDRSGRADPRPDQAVIRGHVVEGRGGDVLDRRRDVVARRIAARRSPMRGAATTVPSASTSAASTFVPPRSTARARVRPRMPRSWQTAVPPGSPGTHRRDGRGWRHAQHPHRDPERRHRPSPSSASAPTACAATRASPPSSPRSRAGYRLLDTAVNYENEREVGEAVRESGVDRDELIVDDQDPGSPSRLRRRRSRARRAHSRSRASTTSTCRSSTGRTRASTSTSTRGAP